MDYYFNAAMEMITGRAVMTWLVCAFLAAFFAYGLHKNGKMKSSTAILIPVLVFYLAFVLTITIIERTPTDRKSPISAGTFLDDQGYLQRRVLAFERSLLEYGFIFADWSRNFSDFEQV